MTETTKVLHLSTSDCGGGAFRAAYRIHRALVDFGVDSRMRVLYSGTKDELVSAGAAPISVAARIEQKIKRHWRTRLNQGWRTDNTILHSFGHNSAGLVNEINSSSADIVNLHWICDLLSVSDIGRLKKPIVWRLADMWAFCGGEHYALDGADARFRNGYLAENRPTGERGPDLNRQTWEAKRQDWAKQQFIVVCTTQWLADCARQSVLFEKTPIHVIPNTLDTENTWRPISRVVAREALNLPLNKKLILMGADGGVENPYKGGDLLREAIARVTEQQAVDLELIIFGQSKPANDFTWPCPVHWMGRINDDRILALAYSAADVMVVPSRQEAFGQTASEAQACGTPVVAFDNSGLTDIVTHRKTGWLAKAFDINDLAYGISWIIEDGDRLMRLSEASRKQAVERFSEVIIAKAYHELYEQVLAGQHHY